MGKDSETKELTKAIAGLTRAVAENTATLKKALGESSKSAEAIADALASEARESPPENETPQERLERVAGRLLPSLDVGTFNENAKEEIKPPLGDRVPFQGLIGANYPKKRYED